METEKMKWRGIGIPEAMYLNIRKVLIFTGHVSVSEYVREKVNASLTYDLMKYDELQEHLEALKKEKEEIQD